MLTGCRALRGNPPALTAAPSCPHSLSVEKLIVTVIDGFLSAGIWPGLFRERGEVQGRGCGEGDPRPGKPLASACSVAPFNRRGNGGFQDLSYLSEVTLLASGRARSNLLPGWHVTVQLGVVSLAFCCFWEML